MKKLSVILLIGALVLCFSNISSAQKIILDIDKAGDEYGVNIAGVGSVPGDTLLNVPGSMGFYMSIYAVDVAGFVGFNFRIAFDGTNISNGGFVTQLKEGFTTMEESPIHSSPTGAIVQYTGSGGTAFDTLVVAHTQAQSFVGVDVDTAFLGRITFITGAGFSTSDQIVFTLSKSEFSVDDIPGSSQKLIYAPLTNMHNAALNGALPEMSLWTPVEMVSFGAAVLDNSSVELTWKTSSETNNFKFDVLRGVDGVSFVKVGSVEGHGTTNVPQSYSFVDGGLVAGDYSYRLKQVDYDGASVLTDIVKVTLGAPNATELGSNFPNPFNPTTTIPFTLSKTGNVTLTVYNILGQKVRTLIDHNMQAGVHNYFFDASGLSSGMYFYRLEAEGFSYMKKLVVLR